MNTQAPQMRYLETREVPLSEIEVGERLRVSDTAWVAGLAESMAATGQKTPIEIVESLRGRKKRYQLIAGGHRMAAAELLGWETIRAEVRQYEKGTSRAQADLLRQLAEIDENLIRHELTPLDRAVFIGRRMEVYAALHPDAGRGGDRKSADFQAKNQTPDSGFRSETAEKMGLGETTVQRAVRIYKLLSPELRSRIAGTGLARNESDLYRLTRHSPDQQQTILDRIAEHDESVSQASAWVEGAAAAPKPQHEITLGRLQDAWRRGNKPGRVAFMQFLAEIGVVETFDEGQC